LSVTRNIRALVVAYYFPPMGLSGVQRTAKLVKYLPDEGVDVTVLTVRPGGYFAFDQALLGEVQREGVTIIRTPSADPTQLFGRERQVALPPEGGRRPVAAASQFLLQPDNKIGWLPFAVRAGRRILAQVEHDLIFATAPPYTGLMVAERLAGHSGLPLVTDFRDDWVGNPRHTYPTAFHYRMAERQEARVLDRSARIHVINDHIAAAIVARKPSVASRIHVVPQGFDPADFPRGSTSESDSRSGSGSGSGSVSGDTCTFLYTGVFYDAQRPDTFLKAFAAAGEQDHAFRRHARARFVGLVPAHMAALVTSLSLDESVSVTGYLSHPETVREQQQADILWLTVGNRVGAEGISTGKLYEYLGARTPILGLVPDGVARQTLAGSGMATCMDPDSVEEASRAMLNLFHAWKRGDKALPDEGWLSTFDRRQQACRIAQIFRTLTGT